MTRSRPARPLLAAVAVAALVGSLGGAPASGATAPEGRVFMVNPVQSSGEQSLTDQKDSATAVPDDQYADVPLTNLDGSGFLRGDYANVVSNTGKPVSVKTGYSFDRHSDQFEQVMAYYWVTQAQLYLQSLDFTGQRGHLPAVNQEPQDVRLNQWGVDNSFFTDKQDLLRFGKGGVDDAEDAEVIVHEYGHAVQDAQVSGFGSSLEAGSIGEAFGDYLAVEVGLWTAGQRHWPVAASEPCVADWDSTSYTRLSPPDVTEHCLRRLDGTKTVDDVVGEVHADGEIWSAALWDIRDGIIAAGGTQRVADRIIIDAQFSFAADTSFDAAATATLQTAHTLYGGSYDTIVTGAFAARGITAG
jgi:zinc metalloprotease ZmpB